MSVKSKQENMCTNRNRSAHESWYLYMQLLNLLRRADVIVNRLINDVAHNIQ